MRNAAGNRARNAGYPATEETVEKIAAVAGLLFLHVPPLVGVGFETLERYMSDKNYADPNRHPASPRQ